MKLWQEQTWICNLPLTLTSCMTLGKQGTAAQLLPGAARSSAEGSAHTLSFQKAAGPRKHGHTTPATTDEPGGHLACGAGMKGEWELTRPDSLSEI